jgi:hypothetical protein
MLATECTTYDGNLRNLSLEMLRPLGGRIGVNYCCSDTPANSVQEVQTVFVSCPMTSWVATVGQPQHVRPCSDLPGGNSKCCWEQDLPHGHVRCLGYIFTSSRGVSWIIVRQFSVSRAPAMRRHASVASLS